MSAKQSEGGCAVSGLPAGRAGAVAACLVLVLAAMAGWLLGGDFGMAWDEPAQREIGRANARAVGGDFTALERLRDRDYGPVVELLLYPLEGAGDEAAVTAARHRAVHWIYLAGAGAFCGLVALHFGSWSLGLAGLAFLLLHPHLYGHSFFNSKDVPALALWIGGMLATRWWLERPSWGATLAAGLCVGLLTNLRLAGLLAAGIFVAAAGWKMLRDREHPGPGLAKLAAFAGVFALALAGPWPYLWPEPVARLAGTVATMARFRWDGLVVFGGEPHEAHALPWSYLPVWIAATTPPAFLVLILAGMAAVVWSVARRPGRALKEAGAFFEVVTAASLVVVAAMVGAIRPVVYDGWRHFFFLYGPLAFLGVAGLRAVLEWGGRFPNGAGMVWGGFVAACAASAMWMAGAHPLQHVYFNGLVARKDDPIWRRMERDYWGTSFRLGLEWVARERAEGAVRVSGWPLECLGLNHRLLPERDRDRLRIVEPGDSWDYFITNWRGITDNEGAGTQVHRVILNDSEVLSVFGRGGN